MGLSIEAAMILVAYHQGVVQKLADNPQNPFKLQVTRQAFWKGYNEVVRLPY